MDKINRSLINNLDCLLPKSRMNFKNVLIIDDIAKNLKAFVSQFRKDVNVFTASTKKEAIEIVCGNNIDFVFCDYKMPKYNGAEVLKDITEIYPNIKRAIITSYADNKVKQEVKEKSNTTDIINKPYLEEEIISRVCGINK